MLAPSPTLSTQGFALSAEEALALLEMCALTLAPEHPVHLRVLLRLSRFYEEKQHASLPTKSVPQKSEDDSAS